MFYELCIFMIGVFVEQEYHVPNVKTIVKSVLDKFNNT